MKFIHLALRNIFKSPRHQDDVVFFRGVALFHGLSRRQLARVGRLLHRRHYRAGEILFREGQMGRAVYIVQSAKVELTRKNHLGELRVLGVLGKGQIFGEMALLENLERTATATVVEEGTIYFLYTSSLDEFMRQTPSIGVKLLKNMAVMLSSLLRRANQTLDLQQG